MINPWITRMRKLCPRGAAFFPTGMESAIIGILLQRGKVRLKQPVFVLSRRRIIKHYMADGMSFEEAVEFCEYNLVRALPYYGNSAPILRGSYR